MTPCAVCITGGSSEVGPKPSETTEPEPLVRDESLRKTEVVREWDRGKKTVYGTVEFTGAVSVLSQCIEAVVGVPRMTSDLFCYLGKFMCYENSINMYVWPQKQQELLRDF